MPIKHLVLDDVDGEFSRDTGKLVVSARGRNNTVKVMKMVEDGGHVTIVINNEGDNTTELNETLSNEPWVLESVVVLGAGSLAFVDGKPSDVMQFFKKGREIEFGTSGDAVIKTVPPVGSCLKLTARDRSMIDTQHTSHPRMVLTCQGSSHIRVGRVSTMLTTKCDAGSVILASYDEECVTKFEGVMSKIKQYVNPDVRKREREERQRQKDQRAREMARTMKRLADEFLEEVDEELENERRARRYGALPLEEEEEVVILDDHVMDAGDIQAVTDNDNPNPERTILDRLDDYVTKLTVLARLFGYIRTTLFFEFSVNECVLMSKLNARQRASLIEKLKQKEAELLSIAPPPGPDVPDKATLESDPRDQCVNCIDMRGDRVMSCGHDHYCEGCIHQWVLARPAGAPPTCPQCRREIKWVRTMGEDDDDDDAVASSSSAPPPPRSPGKRTQSALL